GMTVSGTNNDINVYGNALRPTELGSGGSGVGSTRGGTGGGFVYINATNKFIIDGTIKNDGTPSYGGADDAGGGTGGSILVYAYNITGTGNFSAIGGAGRNLVSGGGRIAVYYNHTTLNFSRSIAEESKTAIAGVLSSPATGTFIAVDQRFNNATIHGWNWNSSVDLSIFNNITFVSANTTIDNNDIIRIDNNFQFDGQSYINCKTNLTRQITISEIGTGNTSRFMSGFRTECPLVNLTINSTNNILVSNNNLFNFSIINLDNSNIDFSLVNSKIYGSINLTLRNLSIDLSSWLNATGKGYEGPLGIGNSSGRNGASYGGFGGGGAARPYGNPLEPRELGSGSGGTPANSLSIGGGFIFLNISNKLTINGIVTSDGIPPTGSGSDRGGGASGGSILIYAYNITGTGNFSAKGATIIDNSPDASGGSGGRIAIYYNYSDINFFKSNVSGGGSDIALSRAEPGTFIAIDLRNNIATIVEAFEFNMSNYVTGSNFKSDENSPFTFENITLKGGDELRLLTNVSFNITKLNWSTSKINVSDYLEIIYEDNFNDTLTTYNPVNNGIFNLSIERRYNARIDFLSNLSYIMNISAAINISPNFVKVNSTFLPQLNMSSRLTFYNVSGDNGIPLYDLNDGNNFILCRYDRCNQKNFTADLKKFSVVVTGFTTYTTINDSSPPNITFVYPTEENNVYVNRDWIFINTSIIELNPDNITYLLMNQTGIVNSTLYYMVDSSANNTINFTTITSGNFLGLTDGIYNYNATLIDLANNRNSSETRIITLDKTAPQVSFNDTVTPLQGAALISAKYYVQLTILEENTANITYNLYDATGIINTTTYSMNDQTSNITTLFGLLAGTSAVGVNITDKANNMANTGIRTVTYTESSGTTTSTGGSAGSSGGGGGGGTAPNLRIVNSPPLQIIGQTGLIQTPHGEVTFTTTNKGGVFTLNINSTQGAAEIGLTFINASYGINVPKLDIKLKNGGKLKLVPTIDFRLPVIDPLSLLLLIILLIIIISYEYYRYKKKEELSKVPPHLRYVPITRPITSSR
ncbi:MAG: hypothetical protein AABX19_00715, partial [Nanoarchaeota archaeon]